MDLKDAARQTRERATEEVVGLSHRIHANPELGFEEHQSSRWVADALAGGGFRVESDVGGLPTAFAASAGSGDLTIAICAEYDALPDVGHACGHNVIASAAVTAGLALAPLADDLGVTVKVFGTPAEEGGGGKILMLDRGMFDGVHAAMMVHPSPRGLVAQPTLAVSHLEVGYSGKEAHASSYPQEGVNAGDALTVAQVSVGLLRQHIRATDRIHGIVTGGGQAPNVIPGKTTASYYARARTLEELAELRPRAERCFEAGATATGCTLTIDEASPPYSEFDHDGDMAARYRANAEALGREFDEVHEDEALARAGSTDMANVSLALPAIHPMIRIECGGSSNHQHEFAAWCARPSADKAALDGGLAMAWTVIDLATDDTQRRRLLARPAAPHGAGRGWHARSDTSTSGSLG
ncbi:MAG: M20 family metallopeptidase [Streptosporangiaceae bacterium]